MSYIANAPEKGSGYLAVFHVANREQPLKDSTGVFTISEDGNLMVLNSQKHTLWSSNMSNIIHPNSSIAQLLDCGVLVLKDNTTGDTLWESFQNPSDTFLPKMKLQTNPETGERVKLTSWKSPSDPTIGSFSVNIERPDVPEAMVFNGSKPYWRSGPWNGRVFLGIYQMNTRYLTGFYLGKEDDGTSYITYDKGDQSYFGLLKLNSDGKLKIVGWVNKAEYGPWIFQDSKCDVYGYCMNFGICNRQNSTKLAV
ncbi:G-type lectin S-receptor-like serine/threonine-protein kinase At1g11330 [Neltuma alba]|uniref:G-type lectin S-receptor-like serine/threonine-protein kinase At1g11330 n=1 Tax=Neltuma alba TaxID=207710 RepID=UPI0010A43629|nr:G-type lectin S-receptor-like serine/threonine-protein kinase At1g11330 [Prosopis alba]